MFYHQLNVPEEKFEKKFGLPWKKALGRLHQDILKNSLFLFFFRNVKKSLIFAAEGKVFNASDACKELNIDSAELDRLWAEAKAVCL